MVATATLEVNRREIPHLLYSPSQILFGFNPVGALEIIFPLEERRSLVAGLASGYVTIFPGEMINHILKHKEIQTEALEHFDPMKDKAAERHNLGIKGNCTYSPGEMVMLYGHRQSGRKLRPNWRGPFVVTGFGGSMGKS
ncbi:hypothetical protein OnM2_099002 [Erysiphe neolycopersici]|uniref:Uncharacterized protein n=1 Tax=Erysiphe neolycopersici TaxID=212602 RepID=A0A420HA07_9PEZI|nr:hypothetical protein OnM2_099002 [Erysiphe neolycopersici]